MVIAIATYTIPDPSAKPHERDVSPREVHEVSAEAGTWEAAQEACQVPDGAQVMHWTRG